MSTRPTALLLAAVCTLGSLFIASETLAVPHLQLYLPDSGYDETGESWLSYDNPFTLQVAGVQNGNTQAIDNLQLHLGVPSGEPDWMLQFGGQVSIQGPGVDTTLTFSETTPEGTPDILPGNGTPDKWPGYYYSLDLPVMDFSDAETLVEVPDFSPDPGGSGQEGLMYDYTIGYDSHSIFGLHMDLTGTRISKKDQEKSIFAPYSHNADATGHHTPEPKTMALFGTGLLCLAIWGRTKIAPRTVYTHPQTANGG